MIAGIPESGSVDLLTMGQVMIWVYKKYLGMWMCVSQLRATFYWIKSVSRVLGKLCTSLGSGMSPHDILDKLKEKHSG